MVGGHVVGVPAVVFAEEAGNEFYAELGGHVFFIIQGVVFDHIYAYHIAVAADVVGQKGDFAVGEAFGAGHAGTGGVELVYSVQVQADPDVRHSCGQLVYLGYQGTEAFGKDIKQGKGVQMFTRDEIEFCLVPVVAADVQQVMGSELGVRAVDVFEFVGAKAHQACQMHAVDITAERGLVGVHIAVSIEVDEADIAVHGPAGAADGPEVYGVVATEDDSFLAVFYHLLYAGGQSFVDADDFAQVLQPRVAGFKLFARGNSYVAGVVHVQAGAFQLVYQVLVAEGAGADVDAEVLGTEVKRNAYESSLQVAHGTIL